MGILKTLSKRRSVFFIVLILAILVIISGIFLFKEEEEYQSPQFEKHVDDFIIEGNVIKNEKEGLTITIPDGWTAEKEEQVFEDVWGVSIFSPDIDIEENRDPDLYFLNKGCVISVNIKQDKDTYDFIKASINDYSEIFSINDEKVGVVKINNQLAFKEGGALGETIIRIAFPVNDKVIYFSLISAKNDKDFCSEKISEFFRGIEVRD